MINMKKYQILENYENWFRLICLENGVTVDTDNMLLECKSLAVVDVSEEEDENDYGNYFDMPVANENYALIINSDEHENILIEESFETEEAAIQWFNNVVEEIEE